jgi:WD40 repeat protein
MPGATISPDGKRLAEIHDHWTLVLCDSMDGTENVLFETHDSSIYMPTFSSDSSRVAFIVADTVICVWDSSTQTLLKSPEHSARIRSFVISPDGRQTISICGGDQTTVEKWDVMKDSNVVTLRDFGNAIQSLSFLNTGQLATLSFSGTICTWDMAQGTTAQPSLHSTLPTSSSHDTMAISADRTSLLSCSWYSPSGRWFQFADSNVNEKEHTSIATDAILSPNGSYIASCDARGRIIVLDAKTAAVINCFKVFRRGDDPGPRSTSVVLHFSPDSTRLFYMSPDGSICLITNPTGQSSRSYSYHPQYMMTQDPSALSNRRYTGADGTTLFWLPRHMERVWLASSKQLGYMVFSQGANEVAIFDMTDYLKVPAVAAAWWNGGIKYTTGRAEIASAWASKD